MKTTRDHIMDALRSKPSLEFNTLLGLVISASPSATRNAVQKSLRRLIDSGVVTKYMRPGCDAYGLTDMTLVTPAEVAVSAEDTSAALQEGSLS